MRNQHPICKECGEDDVSNFYDDSRGGFYNRCKPCYAAYLRLLRAKLPPDRREKNRENHNAQMRERYRRIRMEVLDLYGGKCACCGETEAAFLTIDHVNDDGASERRARKAQGRNTQSFLLGLLAQPDFDAYQVLCFNCNCARYFYGGCPHQRLALVRTG